jgi:hypothetical protein
VISDFNRVSAFSCASSRFSPWMTLFRVVHCESRMSTSLSQSRLTLTPLYRFHSSASKKQLLLRFLLPLSMKCCFERDGLTYGITVGHLVSKVSETIFSFHAGTPIEDHGSDPSYYEMCAIGTVVSISPETESGTIFSFHSGTPIEDGSDPTYYEMCAIGTVVSISPETDSLMFLINPKFETATMELAQESGLTGKLVFPDLSPTPPSPERNSVPCGICCSAPPWRRRHRF